MTDEQITTNDVVEYRLYQRVSLQSIIADLEARITQLEAEVEKLKKEKATYDYVDMAAPGGVR